MRHPRVLQRRCSGSLRRSGAYDQGRQVSERIDHLKTADAADIEMCVLFLCEVDASTCERKDAQEMNVTYFHRKISTISHNAIFFKYLLFLPTVS